MFGRPKEPANSSEPEVTYFVPDRGNQTDMASQVDQRSYSVLEGIEGDGTVLIGKGTRIVGEISNCSNVEVQGELEGNLITEKVTIRQGGMITGNVKATSAEVHGSVEGEIEVDGLLDVHSTGRVDGNLAYGQIAIAAGGEVSGNIFGPRRVQANAQPTALTNGSDSETYDDMSYSS